MFQQLLAPTIFAVFSIGFASLWFKNRAMFSAAMFALAYATGAFAFFVELVLPRTGEFVPWRVLADICFISGPLFAAIGLASWHKQKPHKFIEIALGSVFIITTLATCWFWFVQDNLQMRVEIISYGTAILFTLGAVSFYPNIKTSIDRLLFCNVSFLILSIVVMTIVSLYVLNETLNTANYDESIFTAALNFIIPILSLLFACTLFVSLAMEVIEDLRMESTTDSLTNLKNRRAFEASAQEIIETHCDMSFPIALIVCDIDHFKSVNDRFGHARGDEVIKTLAEILNDVSRLDDVVGRVGGEEFVVLLPNATLDMGRLIAERIRIEFENRKWPTIDATLELTASFGVGEWNSHENYPTFFERADHALYQAKNAGRNKVMASPSCGAAANFSRHKCSRAV